MTHRDEQNREQVARWRVTLEARHLPKGEYIVVACRRFAVGEDAPPDLNIWSPDLVRRFACATVPLGMVRHTAPPGHAWLKAWRQCPDMSDALARAGVVEPTGTEVFLGEGSGEYYRTVLCRIRYETAEAADGA